MNALCERLAAALRQSVRYHESRLEDMQDVDESSPYTVVAAKALEESRAALGEFEAVIGGEA